MIRFLSVLACIPVAIAICGIAAFFVDIAVSATDPFQIEKPEPAKKLEPVAQTEPLPPADERPVVEVDSMPREKCIPCGKFDDWLKAEGDDYPIRFIVKKHSNLLPNRVYRNNVGTPAFFWNDHKGKPVCWGGWIGPQGFLRLYQQSHPDFGKLPASAPVIVSTSKLDQAEVFAGKSGKFTFTPDTPIRNAQLDGDASLISYSKISGSYKIDSGKATITLDQPLPVASVRKLGFWFNAQILGANGDEASITVNTSRGKYVLKEAK